MSERISPRPRPGYSAADVLKVVLLISVATIIFSLFPVNWSALPPLLVVVVYLLVIMAVLLLYALGSSALRPSRRVAVATPSERITEAAAVSVVALAFPDSMPGDRFAARALDVFGAVLLHVSTLNNWRGAELRRAHHFLDTRTLAQLDQSLCSSDEDSVRLNWRLFRDELAERMQADALEAVRSLLFHLPRVTVPHHAIPQLVSDLRELVGKCRTASS